MLVQRYNVDLGKSMKKSSFVLDGAKGLNYKFQKISLNRSGRSKTDKTSLNHVGYCVDSPKWLKNKKAKINLKHNDNMCFKYTVTAEFNHGVLENIQENINFSIVPKDQEKFEIDNKTITINIMFIAGSVNIKYFF